MTRDALFGDLRSILQRPASSETWDALCDHLDLWALDALEQVALPYTLNIVTRWPDELERAAPERWVTRLLSGEDAAQVALAASPALSGLKHLTLSGNQLTDDARAGRLPTHLPRAHLLQP